jgi:hypothetical protein
MSKPRRSDAERPVGRRVSTGTPGVYRYITAAGPEFDTFCYRLHQPGKKGGKWVGGFATEEAAAKAKKQAEGMPRDVRFVTVKEFAELYWQQLFGKHRIAQTQESQQEQIRPFVRKFGDAGPSTSRSSRRRRGQRASPTATSRSRGRCSATP